MGHDADEDRALIRAPRQWNPTTIDCAMPQHGIRLCECLQWWSSTSFSKSCDVSDATDAITVQYDETTTAGFKVQASRFRLQGSGFKVQASLFPNSGTTI